MAAIADPQSRPWPLLQPINKYLRFASPAAEPANVKRAWQKSSVTPKPANGPDFNSAAAPWAARTILAEQSESPACEENPE